MFVKKIVAVSLLMSTSINFSSFLQLGNQYHDVNTKNIPELLTLNENYISTTNPSSPTATTHVGLLHDNGDSTFTVYTATIDAKNIQAKTYTDQVRAQADLAFYLEGKSKQQTPSSGKRYLSRTRRVPANSRRIW